MALFSDGDPRCSRCGYQLRGGEDICPRCQFSPRAEGLRVALLFLVVIVLSMTLVMFVPTLGRPLIGLAAISFVLCVLTMVISFVATPHRLGSLFLLRE